MEYMLLTNIQHVLSFALLLRTMYTLRALIGSSEVDMVSNVWIDVLEI